jgi:hypothetical protein
MEKGAWKYFFCNEIPYRIQKTILAMMKPGFLSWVVGTYLIVKGHIPCNSATEYGIFTAGLIFSVGMTKKILGGKSDEMG